MYTNVASIDEGWAAHNHKSVTQNIYFRQVKYTDSTKADSVTYWRRCRSAAAAVFSLPCSKRCLFQKKSAKVAALRFHPPVLAEAQRDNHKAGRPPRNHGDRDESPWGERCYQNTAGNQQMLPYKMKRKSPVLWEKIRRYALKQFLKIGFLKSKVPYQQKTRAPKPLNIAPFLCSSRWRISSLHGDFSSLQTSFRIKAARLNLSGQLLNNRPPKNTKFPPAGLTFGVPNFKLFQG